MASIAHASPEIPFWLQVAAVITAPLLAFAGVAYGAAWGSRSEHRRWLRTERLKSYTEFIGEAEELTTQFFGNLDELRQGRNVMDRRLRKLGRLNATIKLLGPPEVSEPAEKTYDLLVGASDYERLASINGTTIPACQAGLDAQEMLERLCQVAARALRLHPRPRPYPPVLRLPGRRRSKAGMSRPSNSNSRAPTSSLPARSGPKS
jgi:hypothetical protein